MLVNFVAQNNMDQFKVIRPFLIFFFFGGQSCYLPRKSNGFWWKKQNRLDVFLSAIPTVLGAARGLAFSAALYWLNNVSNRNGHYDKSDAIITHLFTVCGFIRTITIGGQSLLFTCAIQNVIQTFLNLENFFKKRLQYNIPYRRFSTDFIRKIILVVVSYAQTLIPFYMVSHFTNNPVKYLLKIMQFESVFSAIHLLFYIDLLRFHLIHLNMAIIRDAKQPDPIQNQISVTYGKNRKEILLTGKYQNYKHVHYHLCVATQQINHFFGWCLTACFLQTFVDWVFISFWFYGALNTQTSPLHILSKWSLCILPLLVVYFPHSAFFCFRSRLEHGLRVSRLTHCS